jgi:NADH-quinone oxidoreductase E subunit
MSEVFFNKYERFDSSSLIPLLQDAQEEYGYLSETMLQKIGDYVGLSLSQVYGVATFYNQFRLTPLGENLVSVCRGTACHVKNSANLLTAIENELGVEAGETTRDKKFTLETVSCIGACSIAPVISINGEFFGRLTPKDVPKILKPFKSAKKKEA